MKKDNEIHSLKTYLKAKDVQIEEQSALVRQLKEQLVIKDDELEQVIKTLYAKGEEATELYQELGTLKHTVIDHEVFDESWAVTRVPPTDSSPELEYDMYERKALTISFFRDMQKQGLFFMRIQT